MTGRQRILKIVYPLWIAFTKLAGKNIKILANAKHVRPVQSIYDLSVPLNNGKVLPLETYKGKKLLIVNTASNCGYTNQYEDLQELYQQFNNQLEIIAFPANDFKEQEKGSDNDIAQFCKVNFGVTFPLAKKSVVVRSADQNNIFNWLTSKAKNGWNEKTPSWNFSKYLIDEQGVLTHYFDPSVSPLSEEVVQAVKK
jgi:glutathione peroxidase